VSDRWQTDRLDFVPIRRYNCIHRLRSDVDLEYEKKGKLHADLVELYPIRYKLTFVESFSSGVACGHFH
jgi:hypothetical protein